jgi:nucleotide-binding universal stress UspA family protein
LSEVNDPGAGRADYIVAMVTHLEPMTLTPSMEVDVYKNILIPTDGTEFCEKAVRHGVALAKLAGARVTGVTVTVPFRRFVGMTAPPDILEKIVESRSEAVEKILGSVEAIARASGVPCETVEIDDEHPYQGIISTAESKGCDLIVMASHGRRGISGVLIGSETQKVITHTTIPVLVCR